MSVKTISIAECQRLIKDGESLNIVDVRSPGEFANLHAFGACLVPLDELDPVVIASQRQGDQTPLYIICQSGGRATQACRQLDEAGVGPVFCIEGGTAAWERAGLPVERGRGKVISLERQVRIAAGSLVFLGVLLAWRVHPIFLIVPAFIGAGLVFAGITDYCGMGMLLSKMPWNRRRG
jgi:rhodanese-related sulfurtransferase